MSKPGTFKAVRPFCHEGQRIDIGDRLTLSSAELIVALYLAGKIQPADPATKKRLRTGELVQWTAPDLARLRELRGAYDPSNW